MDARRRRWGLSNMLCLAAVACTAQSPPREYVPAPQTQAEPRLVLETADADVWSWRVRVHGRLQGQGALAGCQVDAGGSVFAAPHRARDFSAALILSEGRNLVQASCRTARGEQVRSQPVRYTVKLADAPVARARAVMIDGDVVLDGSESTPSERSRAALVDYAWARVDGGAPGAGRHGAVGTAARVPLPEPPPDGDHEFELRVRDAHGRDDIARVRVVIADGRLIEPAAAPPPSWHAGAVVYGVVPPLYGEPPLRSVTAALDALAELGVNVLWLSPIFASLPGDFGYAVVDYLKVRSDYGSDADLTELVAAAHARGLRVLLDLVPNHSSDQHPYFTQAGRLGPRSRYFGFYERDAAGRPVHYFDWEHLPNLDYDSDEVDRFMLEVSAYWPRRFGIDGYRVDVAWGIARRDPAFWPAWSSELRRTRPDALLVAEASARDRYYVARGGFDAAYDWSERLGEWAWKDVFTSAPGIARRLHEAVAASGQHTPADRVLRFLNNNDTGARFITRHGEALTRVATAALLTLPGIPCLYSFDEVGAEFLPYEQTRPLAPAARPDLRRFHEQLIALRRRTLALHGPGFAPVLVSDDVYAFVRHGTGTAREHAVVVLNFGERNAEVELAIPAPFAAARAGYRDALGGGRFTARGGTIALAVPPRAALVLLPLP